MQRCANAAYPTVLRLFDKRFFLTHILGSQAPIELFCDCLIIGFIVVVIESNFHVAQDALFSGVNFRAGKALLHSNLYIDKFRTACFSSVNRFSLAFTCILLAALSSMSPLLRILQYGMSLIHISNFFQQRFVVYGLPIYLRTFYHECNRLLYLRILIFM